MAYKIRTVSKKDELNQPDEFISAFDRLSDVFRTHTGPVLFAVAGAVLLAVLVGGYFWYEGKRQDAAARLEIEAAELYHQEIPPSTDSGAPSGSREDSLRKAIEKYREVSTLYPGTRSAVVTQYYIGNAHLELGEYDQAVTAYRTFLDDNPGDAALRGIVQERLGYAYLKKGDRAAAAESFESALNNERSLNRDQALFELGRIRELEGKKEEAIQHYLRILREQPLSLLIPDARERLKGLGVMDPETTGSGQGETAGETTAQTLQGVN